MAVILLNCAREKDQCGSAAHRRPPVSGDGMTTGDPTHDKSGRPSKQRRAVCGYVRPRPRRRCGAHALSFSTVTQLRPPPVCTGRGIREERETTPAPSSLIGLHAPELAPPRSPLASPRRASASDEAMLTRVAGVVMFSEQSLTGRSQLRKTSWRTSCWVAPPRQYSAVDQTHFSPRP